MTPYTPEELDRLEALAKAALIEPWPRRELIAALDPEAVLRLLAQVRAAEARWEALKAGVADIHAHWASFHSVAPAAVAQIQTLIARLERERDHE